MSLAHEIGHLILNECAGRELSYDGHSDADAESLCNHIAGELLVPDWALMSYLNSSPMFEGWANVLSSETVLRAAGAFEISVEVMAKRMFRDLQLAPSRIAVIWRCSENRKSSKSEKKLRVAAAWYSSRDKLFVALNKTVPNDSLVFQAYETGEKLRGREFIDLGSIKREFLVDAVAYPSFTIGGSLPPTRSVLSLLTPS